LRQKTAQANHLEHGVDVVTETIEEQAGDDRTAFRPADAEVSSYERRRAGRQDVNAALVPLLRDPASFAPALDHPSDAETPYRDYLETNPFHNELAPARGIMLGLAISMLFWGAVGYMIFR
jgi:hypothetical protein